MTKDEQIENQANIISTLTANNAALRRKCIRLIQGQDDLRKALYPDNEPTTADEWALMVQKARAEIEAEDAT